ncbi:hypothetical protein CIG11343_0114 [Campylobacter iguaniorum]|uniref:hypothetical protein n=1 Tax=Campylobacter iguaniorum TaxID=1244531 RepID=UPI000739F876|nr:hypothetical protein [Campylobacter iguaniorum]ALV23779.1 hypothetical protein CIG2463D_0168 [Campylobacter iguaniorum]ANE35214.1 hypothetical protein CIG11343_0114 [Campylobacter iguaniorum]
MKRVLASNEFLDGYICNYELSNLANISSNAYKFWKNEIHATYENSRTVFLYKKSIPQKYQHLINLCLNLDGFVLSSAFCSLTGLSSSHLVKSNRSNLYEKLEIISIGRLKFVNLKKLYDDLNLKYDSHIYIEKCKYFSPPPLEKRIKLTDTLCLGYY